MNLSQQNLHSIDHLGNTHHNSNAFNSLSLLPSVAVSLHYITSTDVLITQIDDCYPRVDCYIASLDDLVP